MTRSRLPLRALATAVVMIVILGVLVVLAAGAATRRRLRPAEEPARRGPPAAVARVGVIGPLTGPASGYGVSQREGATLAAEDILARGGAGGASIVLAFADDGASQERAAAHARELAVRDRVAAIVGAINSDCTHQIEMVAVKLHVPQVTTASTDPSITDTGSPWIFRCLGDDVLQAKAIAERLFSGPDAQRARSVALVAQDNRYGRMGIAEVARAAAAAKATVVCDERYASGTTDFSAVADRVVAARPDAIVLWSLYREGAGFVRALRSAGASAPLFAGDGLVSPEYPRLGGTAAEGTVVTFPFDPDASERSREFARRFHARFSHAPDSFAAHAYDAILLLADAADRAGGWDRVALRDALATTSGLRGVTGDLAFDATGNDTRPIRLARVVEGRFVPLRDESPRSAP